LHQRRMFGGQEEEVKKARPNPREGEVAERVDEDQLQKFGEIIDLLLAGGYFRARITGLSPFDKVVGGMAWSITASNVDVDVDLFFQENSSIGQRIKLGEKLIEALHKMKCPYPLQAQQIQGLDYINLFPVIQWLIKKVIETREETGDLLRMYSESQFNKSFQMPQDIEFKQRKENAVVYAHELNDHYRPQRRYRRQQNSAPTIHATLLEYGKFNRMSRFQPQEKKPQTQTAKMLQQALGGGGTGAGGEQAEDLAAAEEKHISEVMKTLDSVAREAGKKVSGSVVGSYMSADQIQQIASQYEEMGNDAAVAGLGQRIVKDKQHKQKVAALEKQIEQQKGIHAQARASYEDHNKKLEEIQQQVAHKEAFNDRIVAETKKLDQLENQQNAKQLQMLRNLVGLNESLRTQEVQFKANCKRQMLHMKGMIEALQKEHPDDDDVERRKLIEDTYAADTEKLKKIKQLASKKNRDIAMVERKIDEVPSRTELLQYQRQFVDLYEQVASRLTETRQYFSTYNTLEDTRTVLAREVSILNSIHDNYKTAMSSKQMREKFLESMDGIVKGVVHNLEKEETKLAKEKKTSDELNDKYLKLVEKERNYYRATKEFQEECKKNELLLTKLAK
jgi:hypothetical protein